jgi:predicted ArsR family transcriptional regulator
MISCTEFIPAYSELFKFLEAQGGKEAVAKFWESLSDDFLTNLHDLAATKGLAGCFEYWSHTLTEEAADFRMTLDEKNGTFEIDMRDCPSRGALTAAKHIEPYEHYCEHCDVLYRRVLEPFGIKYNIDLSTCKEGTCKLTLEKKPSA